MPRKDDVKNLPINYHVNREGRTGPPHKDHSDPFCPQNLCHGWMDDPP